MIIITINYLKLEEVNFKNKIVFHKIHCLL